jgi:HSP90 family molecular chaperone
MPCGVFAAACLLNDYMSSDGFNDFRMWLISRGREVYMTALKNTDSLADLLLRKNTQTESDAPDSLKGTMLRKLEETKKSIQAPSVLLDIPVSLRKELASLQNALASALDNATTQIRGYGAEQVVENKFYLDQENGSVRRLYYNPDSSTGGQYVEKVLDFALIREADNAEDFFSRFEENCKQYLIDIGTDDFAGYNELFKTTPGDFEN